MNKYYKSASIFLASLSLLSFASCSSNNNNNSTLNPPQAKDMINNINNVEGETTDNYIDSVKGITAENDLNFNTEEYNSIKENGFVKVSTQPLSTFAADVDTGSYCNFRRMINSNQKLESIPSGAIRTEEMLNYFDYDFKETSNKRFGVNSEIQTCPWNKDNKLLMLTITANKVEITNNGNNFVYLIDTSGSMSSNDKADMVYDSFKLLTESLNQNDKVSIVTYASDSSTLLNGCNGSDKEKINQALATARDYTKNYGGGTNGSGGIENAYKVAMDNFIENGNNRVIIASDGDMNLSVTSQSELIDLIKEKKESGVFLTTLGYGSGNYSDANMEQIADAGNGNYYYIDCLEEANHVLVEKLKETTITIAKDVKLQVEFNPKYISEYRLIGYENRTMNADDFEDDTKDGGEVGAGQQVVVFYELITNNDGLTNENSLRYQEQASLSDNADSNEVLTLSINYKEPKEEKSKTESHIVLDTETKMSEDFSFGSSIIETAMIIHKSDYIGTSTINDAINLAKNGTKNNKYRLEFVKLLNKLE